MRKSLLTVLCLMLAPCAQAGGARYELQVDGLACPYCAYGIEKKIAALQGVEQDSLEILLNKGLVVFRADSAISQARLKKLVNDAGFTLRGVQVQPVETGAAGDD